MVVDEDGVQKCKSVNFRASKFYGGTHDYIYGDVLFMAESWGPDGIDFVTLPDYFTLEYFIAKLG